MRLLNNNLRKLLVASLILALSEAIFFIAGHTLIIEKADCAPCTKAMDTCGPCPDYEYRGGFKMLIIGIPFSLGIAVGYFVLASATATWHDKKQSRL